jgi:hypothetical protein
MAYEAKPQTGALFINKIKKHPKAPDYQGDLLIDPKQMTLENGLMKIKLGGWKKTTSKGIVFLSLAVDTYKPKEQSQPRNDFSQEIPDEEIPF